MSLSTVFRLSRTVLRTGIANLDKRRPLQIITSDLRPRFFAVSSVFRKDWVEVTFETVDGSHTVKGKEGDNLLDVVINNDLDLDGFGCKLWDPAVTKTSRQTDNFKSKRKVVQMLALLVGLFALCWLPYHVYFIVVHHHPQLSTRPYVQHMYLAFYWLAMSNAMFNPIVYYLLNARFRYFFWQLLSGAKESWKNCLGNTHTNSSVLSVDDDPFAFHLQVGGEPVRGLLCPAAPDTKQTRQSPLLGTSHPSPRLAVNLSNHLGPNKPLPNRNFTPSSSPKGNKLGCTAPQIQYIESAY